MANRGQIFRREATKEISQPQSGWRSRQQITSWKDGGNDMPFRRRFRTWTQTRPFQPLCGWL